jgi:hypothetical protein
VAASLRSAHPAALQRPLSGPPLPSGRHAGLPHLANTLDLLHIAAGSTWVQTTERLQYGYRYCVDWLIRAGVYIEPDKSELIFFRRRRNDSEVVGPPHTQSGDVHLFFRVSHSQHIRHLGFLSADLTWDRHIKITCNQAKASLESLQIRGSRFPLVETRIQRGLPAGPHRGPCPLGPQGAQTHFKRVYAVQN